MAHLLPLFEPVDVVVVMPTRYGLMVKTDAGVAGYIEDSDVADGPIARSSWPEPGDRVRAVVLGTRTDGRVVFCSQVSVLNMAATDMGFGALREWWGRLVAEDGAPAGAEVDATGAAAALPRSAATTRVVLTGGRPGGSTDGDGLGRRARRNRLNRQRRLGQLRLDRPTSSCA